jgi:SAM-dependent methyltransferase
MKRETAEKLLAFSEKEYDTYAREFSDTRPFFWRELEFLEKYARTGKNILDIGCGNGRLLDVFKSKSIHYTGVDSSKDLILLAQKYRGEKGIFIHANALSLPFQENTFDIAFSVAVLHHIPSKEFREQFVREAYRVLRPEGILILTVWNILQWHFFRVHLVHSLKKMIGMSDMDFGDTILSFGQLKRERYVHAFTKRELRKLLQRQGFTISSTEEIKRRSGYSNLVVVAKKS